MTKQNKIIAQQAEPPAPRTPSPDHGLGRLVRGMLMAQGFRLDR